MDTLTDITNPQLRKLIDLCHKEIPGFEIRFKDSSRWMKFLNFFAQIFNKGFMTRYITTTGSKVYFPSKAYLIEGQEGMIGVLAHELVHMDERKGEGLVPNFLRYAFPQILAALAALSILGIWNLWFLLFLGCLIFLAPLPAPGRRDIELEGYTMSLAVLYWKTGVISDDTIDWYAKQFSGPAYYFMYPWHSASVNELRRRALSIRSGSILSKPVFRKVYEIVKPKP